MSGRIERLRHGMRPRVETGRGAPEHHMKPDMTSALLLAIVVACTLVARAMRAAMRICFEPRCFDRVARRDATLAGLLPQRSNALRRTDPDGIVRVAAHSAAGRLPVGVQGALLAVSGPLPSHPFVPLFRVDASRSRQVGRSRCAPCKHIADAHGRTAGAMRSPRGGQWIRLCFSVSASSHEY
ncbi:hypothetical protein [Burkholderia sp. BCC1977]|uniref:hypothetical protein n=1 Tax=Burkholderia sp. BCC1977 TaxID=2817440 RepID=UPI002ABDC55B|nr:hypothetical protein [Burkholderia sp. BCC1977]